MSSSTTVASSLVRPAYPFAWSQLVFYRRGPEYPLSLPLTSGHRQQSDSALQRTFQDAGNRRILINGFIGRRTELHSIRRRLHHGQRVFVFHGLGGLGKTTLAVHLLSWLDAPEHVCVVGLDGFDITVSIMPHIYEKYRQAVWNDESCIRAGSQVA